jgi:branched-chain amino acid transport system substrate-binding protein
MIRHLATGFLACVFALVAVAGPAAPEEPFEIHAILSLAGGGAFVGRAEGKTLAVVETYVNAHGGIHGRAVHFTIQDDESNPQTTVQFMNALIAQHVPVVLGPNYAASCAVVLPLVVNGPVRYCFSPSVHPPPGSYTFSVGVSTKDLALAGLRYLRDRGLTRIAQLHTIDATGQDGENVIREDLALPEMQSMKIVDTEHFSPADLTVTAQLSRIKAAGAQAIITWVIGPAFGTVLRSAADSGTDIPIITDAGNISNTQMAQYTSFLPKQLYFTGFRFLGHSTIGPGPVRDVQTAWLNEMHAAGVANPDSTYTNAWDAALVIVDAFRHVGTSATAQQLHDYLEQMHGFAGINGLLDFRDGSQRGLTPSAALIVRYDPRTAQQWIPVSAPGGLPIKPPARNF